MVGFDDFTPTYGVVLTPEPVVLPREQLSEWLKRLRSAAAAAPGVVGQSSQTRQPDERVPFYRVETSLGASVPYARLWWVELSDDEHVLIVVDDQPVTDDRMAPWVAALAEANARLGERESFVWSVCVGQTPTFGNNIGQRIKTECTVGDLRIEPGVLLHEWGRSSFGASGEIAFTYPSVVHGMVEAYDWSEDGARSLGITLHRLCSLLSLLWDSHWTVRGLVQSHEHSAIPPSNVAEGHAPEGQGDSPVSLPDWVDEAWAVLGGTTKSERRVSRATAMYREGVGVQGEHPSLALNAFTSVVETLADRVDVAPCEKCENVPGVVASFRAAVESVAPELAPRLTGIYKQRSRTSHDAHLHGSEVLIAGPVFGWVDRPEMDFDIDSLWPMRDVARRLVLRSLGHEDASRQLLGLS